MLDRKTKSIDAREELLLDRVKQNNNLEKIYFVLWMICSFTSLGFYLTQYYFHAILFMVVGIVSIVMCVYMNVEIKYKGILVYLKKNLEDKEK